MKKKIKKKIHLTTFSKVLITMVIVALCPFIHEALGLLGESVMTSDLSLFLVIVGWFWLIAGQIMFLSGIWEN